MNSEKNRVRAVGWGVRPPNWINKSCDSEDDSANNVPLGNEENQTINDAEDKMEDGEFARWVSGKWNLAEFDGSKPISERKNEYECFIEQFDRIIEVRTLSSKQKLQAFRIHAGPYLNEVIKTQIQRGTVTSEENYNQVLSDLNQYFSRTCDTSLERTKFRDMKMKSEESFMEYVSRCEKQIKCCNFFKEQEDEEFLEALVKRSIPDISKFLRIFARSFQGDIYAVISQGTDLDNMRREQKQQQEETEVRPVMAVQKERFRATNRFRFSPYKNRFREEKERPRNWTHKFRASGPPRSKICMKCGEDHQWGNCPANFRRCNKCRRWGHFAKCCKSANYENTGVNIDAEVKNINQVKNETDKRLKFSSDEEN